MGEPGSKRTKYTHPYPAHHDMIEVRGQLQPSAAPPFFLDFDSAIGSSSLVQESPAFFESFQSQFECHSDSFSAEEQTRRWVPVHGNLPNISPALAGLAPHLNFAAAATLPVLSDTHPTTGNDRVGASSPLDFVEQDHVSATNTDSNLPSDAVFDLPDIWTNTSLYRLHRDSPQEIGGLGKIDSATPRKRASDQITGDIFSTTISTSSSRDSDFIRLNCPSLFPCVPDPSNRPPFLVVRNPFLESSGNRHPTLANRVRPRFPENGVIDGYIKIRLSAVNNAEPVAGHIGGLRSRSSRWLVGPDNDNNSFLGNNIPLLPPNFSTGMDLDLTDQKLWCFHLNAFCPGRMLLCDNYWENQVAAIAVKDDATRHALLAFSTAYVLDYEPTEAMRKRANHHYRTAVRLIEAALQRQDTYSPGNEDAVVAAIILVLSNDIVNWESRRPKGVEPLWREGARAGRLVLDQSDPGYRYWKPQNVQCSPARIGNANWIAYTDICAQPVTPLTEENTSNLYSWLLAGSRRDVHRVQGITGLCPKLLHTFSQITHLAALLSKNPNGKVVPLAALKIRNRLKSFWQWCEVSEGYQSADELFNSCILDGNGKVSDLVKVTELSAHAWVPAAEIYLHCRVYRKPRSHPHVTAALKVLVQCIKRLPCTGELFTSQSPFFPVTIMAILSYRKEDRKVSQDWFEVVLSGAQCRSSVPPVWDAIKELWGWLDEELMEPDYDEDQPMGHRYPWWEDMVDKLVKHSGVLSLV